MPGVVAVDSTCAPVPGRRPSRNSRHRRAHTAAGPGHPIKERLAEAVRNEMPGRERDGDGEPRGAGRGDRAGARAADRAKRRVPVHHVTVQDSERRQSVSLDIEVDGRMSLAAAHIVASRFETAIRDELGPSTEVETHIEPLVVASLDGRNAEDARSSRSAAHLCGMPRPPARSPMSTMSGCARHRTGSS